MDYDVVLGKILALWRSCGATLKDTAKIQYLIKEPRPDGIVLTLEYGVPKQLRTPAGIYNISTTMYGKTRKFAEEFGNLFDYYVQTPEDVTYNNDVALKNIVNIYNPLTLIIRKMK